MAATKTILTSGKRKKAIARVSLTAGTGKITINNADISVFEPAIARLKLQEPLILAGKVSEKVDIKIQVNGGGYMGQVQAARLAVAKALVEAEASGARLIDKVPRNGAHGAKIGFIHPKSLAGVLTEFCQRD